MDKNISLAELKEIIRISGEKKFVLTGGYFEFLEPWHIDLFNYSKNLGDILAVIIFHSKALIPVNERAEILSAIEVIDYIVDAKENSPEEIFHELDLTNLIVLNREIGIENKEALLKLKTKIFNE